MKTNTSATPSTASDGELALTATPPIGRPSPGQAVRRAVTSELIKLRTLRSQVWLVITAALFTLTMGPLQALGQAVSDSEPAGPPDEAAVAPAHSAAEAIMMAMTGTWTATLLLGVMGVLLVTGEYVPRAVRTTFMLVPRRGLVLAAKAVAGGLVVALTSIVAVAAAATISFALLREADVRVGWGSSEVLRIAAATVWYLVGWVVLGQVAGWVTRSKIGGAALLIGVMLVLAPVLSLLPGRAGGVVVALMPSSVGAAMVSPQDADALIGPAAGLGLWTTYLVGLMAVATWLTVKRDA